MCRAAVNFAQYDFSGLTLNRSPLIRATIPEQGNLAYEVRPSQLEAPSAAAGRVVSLYAVCCSVALVP